MKAYNAKLKSLVMKAGEKWDHDSFLDRRDR